MDEERHDLPEDRPTGARGGSAAFAAPAPGTDVWAWAKTVVRWSPVWVGLLVAMGINLVLYVLSLAVALSTATPRGGLAGDILQTAGIWSAISTIIALFVGGFLAGRLGVQTGLRSGILQGTLVWTLYLFFALLLSLFGVGSFASGVTGLANVRALGGAGAGIPASEATRILSTAAQSLWWLFGALVVSWIAAAIGGYIGERTAQPDTVEHP